MSIRWKKPCKLTSKAVLTVQFVTASWDKLALKKDLFTDRTKAFDSVPTTCDKPVTLLYTSKDGIR